MAPAEDTRPPRFFDSVDRDDWKHITAETRADRISWYFKLRKFRTPWPSYVKLAQDAIFEWIFARPIDARAVRILEELYTRFVILRCIAAPWTTDELEEFDRIEQTWAARRRAIIARLVIKVDSRSARHRYLRWLARENPSHNQVMAFVGRVRIRILRQ